MAESNGTGSRKVMRIARGSLRQGGKAAKKASKGSARFLKWVIGLIVPGISAPLILMVISGIVIIVGICGFVNNTAWESIGTSGANSYAVTGALSTTYINEYSEWVIKYAKKYGIEPAYIYATMEAESNFDPNCVSSAGAKGLLQVMPDTFADAKKFMKLDGEKDDGYTYNDIFKPEVNIKYAVRYFKFIKEKFPKASIKTRAAAFNAGPYAVEGWLKNSSYSRDEINLIYENIPYSETRAYVEIVQSNYDKYKKMDGINTTHPSGEQVIGGTVSKKGYVWPAPGTKIITSGVGPRWGTHHNGIDISSGDAFGKPIVAARSGTVITAVHSGWGGGYGLHVMIDHGDGVITVYGHASRVLVNEGDKVKQGQKIAEIGSTGDSTGPHLHFEIRILGVIMDPEEYVSPE